MTERKKGAYRLLFFPGVYATFQNLVGNKSFRDKWVRDHVKPQPHQRILDIGCGTGDILEVLKAYQPQVQYVGVDISATYIETARTRFGNGGTFMCGYLDETMLQKLGMFDIVLMQGLLHHITDAEAIGFIRLLAGALREQGCILTADACFHAEQGFMDRWLVSKDRGMHVRTPEQYNSLLRPAFRLHKSAVAKRMLRIPYSFCMMEGRKISE